MVRAPGVTYIFTCSDGSRSTQVAENSLNVAKIVNSKRRRTQCIATHRTKEMIQRLTI